MSKLFEEWLVEIAKNENYYLLEKLPEFLSDQYEKAGNRAAERERLAAYVKDNMPRTPFSIVLLETITGTK